MNNGFICSWSFFFLYLNSCKQIYAFTRRRLPGWRSPRGARDLGARALLGKSALAQGPGWWMDEQLAVLVVNECINATIAAKGHTVSGPTNRQKTSWLEMISIKVSNSKFNQERAGWIIFTRQFLLTNNQLTRIISAWDLKKHCTLLFYSQ